MCDRRFNAWGTVGRSVSAVYGSVASWKQACKLVSHYFVALAYHAFKARSVEDPNSATAVFDDTCPLQFSGSFRDALAPHAEHVRDQFLGHCQLVGRQSVQTHQQPSAELLVHGMVPVAHGGLSHLRQQCLCIAQEELLNRTGQDEFVVNMPGLHPECVAGTLYDGATGSRSTPHEQ